MCFGLGLGWFDNSLCVCVCWPWPRLVIIDNIASMCVCVCFGLGWVGNSLCVCWPWPRLVIIDNYYSLCVCVCVCVFWPWPRLVIIDNIVSMCVYVLALASVGYYVRLCVCFGLGFGWVIIDTIAIVCVCVCVKQVVLKIRKPACIQHKTCRPCVVCCKIHAAQYRWRAVFARIKMADGSFISAQQFEGVRPLVSFITL